jgi:hypothetical protein
MELLVESYPTLDPTPIVAILPDALQEPAFSEGVFQILPGHPDNPARHYEH